MSLEGFESFAFTHGGKTRTVFRRGSGPAVAVMHEVPGITPPVAAFAARVAEAGFTVYAPHLFGTPGEPETLGYAIASACTPLEEFPCLCHSAARTSSASSSR